VLYEEQGVTSKAHGEKSDGYHHEIGARVDPCTRVRGTGAGSKPPTGRLLQVPAVGRRNKWALHKGGEFDRAITTTSSRGCRNKRALHKSGEFDRAITTSNFATVLKIKTPRRFFWGFLLVRAGTNYATALCGQRRRAMRAAMITFRSPSAHVSHWRKSDNTCRKRGVDCCSA
jgi:hypothetical protein